MKRQDWLLQNLGNRLRQLWQGRRLRQSAMTSFGLHEKYDQRLELGQVNPTLLTLYKLARTFEISLSNLMPPAAEA
jgi:transcriptional regulator with XRE-family HTH domain